MTTKRARSLRLLPFGVLIAKLLKLRVSSCVPYFLAALTRSLFARSKERTGVFALRPLFLSSPCTDTKISCIFIGEPSKGLR